MNLLNSLNKKVYAGLALFLAGFIIFMGITTAEAYYGANYTTRQNQISDLGATSTPEPVIYQPSSTIFNLAMISSGLLLILAAVILRSNKFSHITSLLIFLLGAGTLGVGLFPSDNSAHTYFAVISFVSGSLAAISTYFITKKPFRYAVLAIGIISLSALLLLKILDTYIGPGGIERWVAYPNTMWMIVMGGYLMVYNKNKF